MDTRMEVTRLTYLLYKFLIKKGWIYNYMPDNKFIILLPPQDLGLSANFKLRLPIKNNSKDFYPYFKDILSFIKNIYPRNYKRLSDMDILNEKLKHRFSNQWILPENKSRINKIDKFDIYIPE